MKINLHKDTTGVAQILVVIVAVVVLAGIGFAAWKVTSSSKSTENQQDNAVSQAIKDECNKHNDDDLCKFFTSWKMSEKYRMTSTDTDGSKSVFEVDGKKSRVSMNMEGSEYEVITIDKTTYTKAGDIWYKKTLSDKEENLADDMKVDFEDTIDDDEESSDKTTYKSLGKESCGDLQCFKYEIVSAEADDTKEFIWFDDKDYLLRKSVTESADGNTEMTFEYSDVSISEPSPVKELGPNQIIMPGQTEPVTMPDTSQFQQ